MKKNSVATFKLRFKVGPRAVVRSPFCRESRQCFICFLLDLCQYANKIAPFYEPNVFSSVASARPSQSQKSAFIASPENDALLRLL